jgi:uncharacterized protein (UPF0335 family)
MTIGHNSVDGDLLKSFIERLEHMDDEKSAIAEQIKAIKSEAKGSGFDVRTIAAILRLRKKDKGELQEEKALMELYAHALGCEDLV